MIAVQDNNQLFFFSLNRLFLLLIFFGCTNADQGEKFDTISIQEKTVILSPDTHEGIAIPSFIRTTRDKFLVFDGNLQKVFVFNYQMDQILSFGNRGRGPGETQAVTNIWITDDHYILYDYNSAKIIRYNLGGMLVDEYQIDISEFSANAELLAPNRLLHSANKKEEMLLQISDFIKSDNKEYFGEAIAGPDETSNEEIRSLINRGEVPNWAKNQLLIGANEEAIFSFQNAMAVLQKYSLDGKLLWEIDVNIPSVEGVFENFLRINREQSFLFPLMYAYDMHVFEFGAALLLRTTEDWPVTILWIPENGKNIQILEYPSIDKPEDMLSVFRFRISPEQKSVFFLHSSEGKVIKSTWPIEHG